MSPTFHSLSIPNYRVYASGAIVSNVGTWMGRVAQDWLVLTVLTDHSATALGLVTGLQFLPFLVLAPFAGMIVDRFPKRRILFMTQTALLLTAMEGFTPEDAGYLIGAQPNEVERLVAEALAEI